MRGDTLTNIDICQKCYLNNTSCCTLKSNQAEKTMVPPVSPAEIKRMHTFLDDKKNDGIVVERPNSAFYVNQILNLFPGMEQSVYAAFPEDGTHFELKTTNDTCVLLGEKGCMLPKTARPHFCSIYPFWFFEDEPQLFQDADCLALQNCNTVAEVFLSLGTNPEMLKQIYSGICQDWELSPSMSQGKMKYFL